MKINHYFARYATVVRLDSAVSQEIHLLGRSAVSESDALEKAKRHALSVQRRIDGENGPRRDDYSADINEEIVAKLSEKDVVTRTRYGARILNSCSLTILDIDSYRRGFWEWLFGPRRPDKEAIVEMLEQKIAPRYPQLGLRIYETCKGIRVIVLGDYLDPKGKAAAELMKATGTDPLYAKLCRAQDCYRARLTPKPVRMKFRSFRYTWPLAPEKEEAAREWVAQYEEAALSFATCRYLRSVGRALIPDAAVDFHDRETGAQSGRKLA